MRASLHRFFFQTDRAKTSFFREMSSRREMRALVNALNVRAHTNDNARSVLWMRRALPLWRSVLYSAQDNEALHATLSSLALLSRKRLIHRWLREFVPRVGEILDVCMHDQPIVERCCAVLRNMSFSDTSRIAQMSTSLMTATRYAEVTINIAVTFAVVYKTIIDSLLRVKMCEFGLKMLASDEKIKRASAVTLLSSVTVAEDATDVFRAANAFECIRKAWPTFPVTLSWIHPMFSILKLESYDDEASCALNAVTTESGMLANEEDGRDVCSVCLVSITDRTLSCSHAFCVSCIRTHVAMCIVGDRSDCGTCTYASIPRCPLCRADLTSDEILLGV
jgi:hypothetical protein